jgi:integrase
VNGGIWLAKYRDESGKRYQQALGSADDARDPDGLAIVSFSQAQTKARDWAQRKERELLGEPISTKPYTVRDAMSDYLDWYEKHRKAADRAKYAANAFILPHLGDIAAKRLTKKRIETWLHDLAETPARLRTRPDRPQKYRDSSDDPEASRRRQSTANRVLTILKAALNRAVEDGKIASDDAWRRVKPFREADAARVHYLNDDETRRLVNACVPGFRPLVQAALFTGMRYGELTNLRVADFNQDSGTVHVRQSKSSKARHVVLNDEGREFFALQGAGKAGDAFLFTKSDGEPWGRTHQQRPLQQACERAKIVPAASFHILRHTYASRLVMRGAPLFVVATQLGHGDTRMVEKHYGHLAPSYVAETIRTAFGELGITDKGNLVPLSESGRERVTG